MKNQAIFSSTDKSKKLKCRLLQFLFGALRVKENANASTCTLSNPIRLRKTKLHTILAFLS